MHAMRREESDHTAAEVSCHDGRALNVLIIESQPLFIQALAAALEQQWPGVQCVSAPNLTEAIERLKAAAVSIVIANAETIHEHFEPIVRAASPAPVLATANNVAPSNVLCALAAGARGYLPKTMGGAAICSAISLALNGGICVPPQSVTAMLDRDQARSGRSGRESEILMHLARGASNKAIARELGLSVATVKLHVQSILRSTGARNRVEAIANARRMGMLRG